MKIPLTWLKDYVDIPKSTKQLTNRLSLIGHMLDKTTNTDNDTVIDVELRGNRADCYGIIGIARDIHAVYNTGLRIPSIDSLPKQQYKNFEVNIESKHVHRFYSCIIEDVRITESPNWMKNRIKDYGMEPVNLIVDITNYVMIETGMPLHAFDIDQLEQQTITLRHGISEEVFESFDGGNINITKDDVVFASGKKILGLVGIVGEKQTGITKKTKRILLECAGYNYATIKKTMQRLHIRTEAGIRHSHNLHPSLCDYALARAVSLINELSPKKPIITGVDDQYPMKTEPLTIIYNTNEVKRLSDIHIDIDTQIGILQRLECSVEAYSKYELKVFPPQFRTDITIEEDIVEEVLRMYGFEHIPAKVLSSEIPRAMHDPIITIEEKARNILSALQMNEIVSIPFVHRDEVALLPLPDQKKSIQLASPPTQDHTHMRQYMFVQQLKIVKSILAKKTATRLFEVGKIYQKRKHATFPYEEIPAITGMYCSKNQNAQQQLFELKGTLESFFSELHIHTIVYKPTTAFPYAHAASIFQGDNVIGTVGILLSQITRKQFQIDSPIAYFILDTNMLASAKVDTPNFSQYSSYAVISVDISMTVPYDIPAGNIKEEIKTQSAYIRNVEIVDIMNDDNDRSLLFRVTFQAKEKNLTHHEANMIRDTIISQLKNKFSVKINV